MMNETERRLLEVHDGLGIGVKRHESINEFLQPSVGVLLPQAPWCGCVKAKVSFGIKSMIRSRADQMSIVHRCWERYRASRSCIDVTEVERQLLQVIRSKHVVVGNNITMNRPARPEKPCMRLEIEIKLDWTGNDRINDRPGGRISGSIRGRIICWK